MYEDFYGLSEKPFSIQPDPSFLYWGRGHRLAYAMLEYGVLNHAGISIVTGEVGCGKTTLIHRLLDQLSDSHTVALLSNIQRGRGDLLSWVLMGFGQPFRDMDHVEKFAELQRFFIEEYGKGRRVVLIIDEAQNLSLDMLEELRMLSNINAGKHQLLQLILIGQPQLKDLLNRPDMLQLAQRVGSDFHLTPLNREEVHAYVETRLAIAGAERPIFSKKAIDVLAKESRGVPRVINIIADTALVYGFSGEEPVINEDSIRAVIRDKSNYGVFGIASDEDLQITEGDAEGPSKFLPNEESDRSAIDGKSASRDPEALRVRGKSEPGQREPALHPNSTHSGAMSENGVATGNGFAGSAAIGDNRVHSSGAVRTTDIRTAPSYEAGETLYPDLQAPPPPVVAETAIDVGASGATAARKARIASPPRSATSLRDGVDDRRPRTSDRETAAGAAAAHPVVRDSAASEGQARAEEHASRPEGVGKVALVVAAEAGAALNLPADMEDLTVVLAVPAVGSEAAVKTLKAAKARTCEIVGLNDQKASVGRARNAAYRRLKKIAPDTEFVQFLDADARLDPDWIDTARAFMGRRPEVAALEGVTAFNAGTYGLFAELRATATEKPDGGILATGSTFFVRTDAFEAAGGFRGDLPGLESEDLCVRLRRRGEHVWRLDAPMAVSARPMKGVGDWFGACATDGAFFAMGAALHGAPPERFGVQEQSRAIVWGGVLPLFILAAAGVAAGAAYVFDYYDLMPYAALAVILLGGFTYFTAMAATAFRHGPFSPMSWAYGVFSVLGRFAEFGGVLKAWREAGTRAKQSKKTSSSRP
ncbi:MAG: AAA family ATPase [Pseudomonadota bacterium]